ncbi:MAG: hypothetical protein QW286_02520 [Candidatus Aenigmatarchaeota archaeon]
MSVDFLQAFKRAIAFCIEPKRWLPFFIIDLAFISAALFLIFQNMEYFIYIIMAAESPEMLVPLVNTLLTIIGLFIGWVLVTLWVTGAVIHQSYKEKEFAKSWGVSAGRYLSLLGVLMITGIISFAVSMIPYVGWIIAILFSLVFLFTLQSVVISKSGIISAIRDSWKIFRKKPFHVFLMWLIISAFSLILLLVFALPLLALTIKTFWNVLGIYGGSFKTIDAGSLVSLAIAVKNQLSLFILSGAILLVGLAIVRAFSLKAQTEFYLQIKKK